LINNKYTVCEEMTKHTDIKVFVAIPIMKEYDYIEFCLESISNQSYQNYEIFVCINQPELMWESSEFRSYCEDNRKTLIYLKCRKDIVVIDKSSRNNGWQGNQGGVGWARKILMDNILNTARNHDLILSLDADTLIQEDYFARVVESFKAFPDAVALAPPYYHVLDTCEKQNKAVLLYEIYLRYYLINMFLIRSPYAFTALGSAMVFPVWAYKSVRGIKPRISGEDFYFLQKLRKFGPILNYLDARVYPSSRTSSRVIFGTGPAIDRIMKGDHSVCPLYPLALFAHIRDTYDAFPDVFTRKKKTPMDAFLSAQFGENDIWQALRNNHKNVDTFVRACYEKVDALRIIQYLKANYPAGSPKKDFHNLHVFLNSFYKDTAFVKHFFAEDKETLEEYSSDALNSLRDFLMQKEIILREENDKRLKNTDL
jgi:hypothetical protein